MWKFFRKSSIYIDRVHALLFHQLKEKHSQIRLSALRICNRLFKYVFDVFIYVGTPTKSTFILFLYNLLLFFELESID
jgi:hypothetical protein